MNWQDPRIEDWAQEQISKGMQCFYCGDKLKIVTPDNIHHVLEKSHYKNLEYEPKNLRLVGGRFDPCNCHGKCHSANPTEDMKHDKRVMRQYFEINDFRDKGL